MNFKKQDRIRLLSIVMAFMLLLSISLPQFVQAQSKQKHENSSHKQQDPSKDNMNHRLHKHIKTLNPSSENLAETEIGYDDGTMEAARNFKEADNAMAVRMSLPKGQDSAMVTGGKFLFWEFWTGGPEIQVEVYDASGPDGAPGEKLAGPIDATAHRNGEWTLVDLSSEDIIVDGDFYMVYVQPEPYPNNSSLGIDEDGSNAERSWQRVGGSWSPAPEDDGNYMIRSFISEVAPPEITSPKDDTYTNQDSLTVEGEAVPTTEVTILNNGKEIATTPVKDDGTFSKSITLRDGQNVLTATSSTTSSTTEPSEPVTVIFDQDKPNLTLDNPKDRSKTNDMAVNVKGTAKDDHLDWVKVNGEKVDPKNDDAYSHRVLLDEGENKIKVEAKDRAGNLNKKTATVFTKFKAPEIFNLEPGEDKRLKSGESVMIEMDSDPGLKPTFSIHVPLTNSHASQTNSIDELPMMEIKNGHYVGYWTATTNLVAKGAEIQVTAKDDYGNKTKKLANGKLFINVTDDDSE